MAETSAVESTKVDIIQAEEKKDVAVMQAAQELDASDASQFIETLDKLQEFKRYSIALAFLFILGMAVLLYEATNLLLAYRGEYEAAIEGSKWIITLISGTVGVIVGFYFGSNAVSAKAG